MLVLFMALPGLLPASQAAMAAPQPGASITTGYSQTCAIASGRAYCWGANDGGQLGDGTSTDSSVPVAVDTSGVLAGKTLTKLAGGFVSTCALDASGAAYCWGGNDLGELGDGTTADSAVPVTVDLPGKALTSITGGVVERAFCALDSSGSAYCWGNNGYGELGDGTTASSALPVAVDATGVLAGKVLTQISAGASAPAEAPATELMIRIRLDNSTILTADMELKFHFIIHTA